MSLDSPISAPRRSFLTRWNTGLASLAALAGMANAQEKSPAAEPWKPTLHDKDNWLDANQAKHRVIFDAHTAEALGESLPFAVNFYHVNSTEYRLASADLAMVVVLRHRGTAFGYNDAMWAKYGEPITKRVKLEDPKTKAAPKANLYNATGYGEQLPNRGATLGELGKLGAQFAVCNVSTHGFASTIATAVGAKPNEIYDELAANLIPNARLVPAGIVAVNRAQERGYTLMSS